MIIYKRIEIDLEGARERLKKFTAHRDGFPIGVAKILGHIYDLIEQGDITAAYEVTAGAASGEARECIPADIWDLLFDASLGGECVTSCITGEEREKLVSEIESLSKYAGRVNTELARTQAEVIKLADEKREAELRLGRACDAASHRTEEIARLEHEVTCTNNAIRAANVQLDKSANTVLSLEATLKQLRSDVDRRETEIQEFRTVLTDCAIALGEHPGDMPLDVPARIASLKAFYVRAGKIFVAHKRVMEENEKELFRLSVLIDTHQAETDALRRELSNVQASLSAETKTAGEFVSKHAALRSECDGWEKKYKDLDRSLMCELRDPNGTIWECARKLQCERDALRARNAALERQNGTHERMSVENEKELFRLSGIIDQSEQRVAGLVEDKKQGDHAAQIIVHALVDLKQRNAELEQKLEETHTQANLMGSRFEFQQQRNAELEKFRNDAKNLVKPSGSPDDIEQQIYRAIFGKDAVLGGIASAQQKYLGATERNAKLVAALRKIFSWYDAKDGHLTTHFPTPVCSQMEEIRKAVDLAEFPAPPKLQWGDVSPEEDAPVTDDTEAASRLWNILVEWDGEEADAVRVIKRAFAEHLHHAGPAAESVSSNKPTSQ